MSNHKTIWKAENDTFALYFEDKAMAEEFIASCGVAAGLLLHPLSLLTKDF